MRRIFLAAVMGLFLNVAQASEWTGGATPDTNWSTAGNWLGGSIPDSQGASAFFSSTSSSFSVTQDFSPVTVGSITINSGINSYTISGNPITFDNNAQDASILVSNGDHTIATGMTLNSSLGIQNGNGILTIGVSTDQLFGDENKVVTIQSGKVISDFFDSTGAYFGKFVINDGAELNIQRSFLTSSFEVNGTLNVTINGPGPGLAVGPISGGGEIIVTPTPLHNQFVFDGETYPGDVHTFSGTITAPGDPVDLLKFGEGTAIFTGTTTNVNLHAGKGMLVLRGKNITSGDTVIGEAGIADLETMVDRVLSNDSGLKIESTGSLDIKNTKQIVKSLQGTGVADLNKGTLTVGQPSVDTTFSGLLTDQSDGSLEIAAGLLTLSGTADYTGETVVGETAVLRAGAVRVVSAESTHNIAKYGTFDTQNFDEDIGGLKGESDSIVVLGTSNTLTFGNNGEDTEFAGNMSGTGTATVVKTGTGKTVFSGTVDAPGGVEINKGELACNGAMVADVDIRNDAICSGSESITGNVTGYDTAILKPGASISTLTINGNLTLNANNTYAIEVNGAGESSKADVSGSVTLNGLPSVYVFANAGNYASETTYTILEYGTLVGSFDPTVLFNSPLFRGTLDYSTPNIVQLILDIRVFGGNAGKAAMAYTTVTGPDADVVNAALSTLDDAALRAAYNQMQPSRFTALALTAEEDGVLVRSSMTHRLDLIHRTCCAYEKLACRPNYFWVEGLADFSEQKNWEEEFGFSTSTGGVIIGADNLYCNSVYLGIAGAYTNTCLTWKESAGHAAVQSGYLGLYGSFFSCCNYPYLDWSLWGAMNGYNAGRKMEFADLDRTAESSHDGGEVGGYVSLGALFPLCGYEFRPFVSLDYIYVTEEGYSEGGASSLDMAIGRKNSDLFRTELGLYLSRCFCLEDCCYGCLSPDYLIPEIQLSWVNEQHFLGKTIDTHFIGSDYDICVYGLNPSRNLFTPSASLTALLCDAAYTLSLRYDAEIGSDYWNQEVSVHLGTSY